jgi:hypothetical protein
MFLADAPDLSEGWTFHAAGLHRADAACGLPAALT